MIFKMLLLYIVTLPVMKTLNLPLLAERIQFSEVVFLFLFFFWMKALIKNKRLPQDAGLNKPILIFLIFCLLSFFNSNNLFLSSIELLGLMYLFIMFVLVADIVDNRQKLDKIIKVWIGALVAVLAFGFFGWLGAIFIKERNIFCEVYENFIFFKPAYRVTSTFRITQGLGNYLVVSLGFVVSELLLSKDKNYKLFLKFMLFFMCLIEIVTFSRSIISFAVVCLLIYNHFHKIRDLRFKIIRFVSAVSIIVVFLSSIILASSVHILSYKIESFSKDAHKQLAISADYAYDPRWARKVAAWEMVKKHPFLGVGLAMFPSYINKLNNENYFKKNLIPIHDYLAGKHTMDSLIVSDPHCDLLGYLAETGILGGGAFIFFIATFLHKALTYLKKKVKDSEYFTIRLLCFFASFVGVLLDSIDVDVFKTRHLWFLMALISALLMIYKNKVDSAT